MPYIVTDSDVIEPGTLAMYSAAAPRKQEEEPAEGEGTTLPYDGKRKLE